MQNQIITCPWCHHRQTSSNRYCGECGHRPDLPRKKCRCRKCLDHRRFVSGRILARAIYRIGGPGDAK